VAQDVPQHEAVQVRDVHRRKRPIAQSTGVAPTAHDAVLASWSRCEPKHASARLAAWAGLAFESRRPPHQSHDIVTIETLPLLAQKLGDQDAANGVARHEGLDTLLHLRF
jgi:hypothetical protein